VRKTFLHKTIARLELGEESVIGILGDSLTAGWMSEKGYVDFLQEMVDEVYSAQCRIYSQGVPGDTASGGLIRLKDILRFSPHAVILQFGLNDAFMEIPREIFKKNIGQMIDSIRKESPAEVLLVTSSYIDNPGEMAMVEPYYKALAEVGLEYSVPVAPVHLYWKGKVDGGIPQKDLVQSDGEHPTVAGYRIMAEAIMSFLRK
jgi:acyl-CoA thioesterase I